MKISSKGRYAVRVMAELGKHYDEVMSVSELSEKQGITIKYLEKVISLLVKAKLIISIRGANGGYKLTKKPAECTIADILTATGDMPELSPCVKNGKVCSRKKDCLSISCWDSLALLITNYLQSVTLEDLINKKI